ncbi:MAG: hypothetical protein IJQ31_12540 [Thermoguttaceae bacterium]|nr:hypothetical protein [Thermoguttaceae bacterium]
MSTNPFPDYNQPQYMTLSPEWSALLKIGRAYRLLFQFNLIWILLTVGFFVATVALAVMRYEDVEKIFYDFKAAVEEEIRSEMKVELESPLNPEAALETQSTELANPSEESKPHFPIFDEEKFLESLGETPLMVLGLFFFVFLIMAFVCFVIQIIVLVRFANCPNSIVPGGHGIGVAYAICMGLTLLLGIFLGGAAGPLNLATLILFLVFSGKVASAVQSQSGRRWLTILIVAICGLFVTIILGGFAAFALAVCETPELIVWGILAMVLVLLADSFLVWLSFLMLYHHLGRDVPRFIEAAMAHYSGRMNQQF